VFQSGKAYKVKVEVAPGQVGFGRVVVLEKRGGKLFVQFRSRSDVSQTLPSGTRMWLVSDAPDNPFNGVWATKVVGSKIIAGQTAMELAPPKFQTVAQRRDAERLPLKCPVRVLAAPGRVVGYEVQTLNISRSGVGLTMSEANPPEFVVGEPVDLVIESPVADIPVTGRVVRSEFNWLHRRNTVGVEFVEMDDETRLNLDRLLGSISSSLPAEDEEVVTLSGLGAWLKSARPDNKFLKPGRSESAPADGGARAEPHGPADGNGQG